MFPSRRYEKSASVPSGCYLVSDNLETTHEALVNSHSIFRIKSTNGLMNVVFGDLISSSSAQQCYDRIYEAPSGNAFQFESKAPIILRSILVIRHSLWVSLCDERQFTLCHRYFDISGWVGTVQINGQYQSPTQDEHKNPERKKRVVLLIGQEKRLYREWNEGESEGSKATKYSEKRENILGVREYNNKFMNPNNQNITDKEQRVLSGDSIPVRAASTTRSG